MAPRRQAELVPGSSATTWRSTSTTSPRTIRTGWAPATAAAAAKRVTALASGGTHAANHAAVAGSVRSSGSLSTPTREPIDGGYGPTGGRPARTSQLSGTVEEAVPARRCSPSGSA